MNKLSTTILTICIIAAGAVLGITFACEDDWCFIFPWQKQAQETITTFEECRRQGYPLAESYPRQCRAGGKTFVEQTEPKPFRTENIEVTSPLPNATVSSPIIITGHTRGVWYFEASFPVRIEDAKGTMLGQHYAQAQGDWMTTELVPFTAKLSFTTPTTTTGFIVLSKDNPSGLPQHNESVRIPIHFSPQQSKEENGAICIQIITPARNPETGETHNFPTPCEIPDGWIIIDNIGT